MRRTKIKTYIAAARLRTLPLSLSGIVTGTALALSENVFNGAILSWALITTVALQVVSNFANDYGDGIKGTDNLHRIGPKRAVQSGALSPKEMKTAVAIVAFIALLSALILIYISFGSENPWLSLAFILLGIGAITAAITYTVGRIAYGYRSLGDIFVFIFFGLVSVAGSYFLYTKNLHSHIFLPATAIGLWSVAVLNLNNMRDWENDARCGKRTLAVRLGARYAAYYHAALIIAGSMAVTLYSFLNQSSLYEWIYLFAFFPMLLHLQRILKNTHPQRLDPELKKMSLSIFLFALLFLAGILIGNVYK